MHKSPATSVAEFASPCILLPPFQYLLAYSVTANAQCNVMMRGKSSLLEPSMDSQIFHIRGFRLMMGGVCRLLNTYKRSNSPASFYSPWPSCTFSLLGLYDSIYGRKHDLANFPAFLEHAICGLINIWHPPPLPLHPMAPHRWDFNDIPCMYVIKVPSVGSHRMQSIAMAIYGVLCK